MTNFSKMTESVSTDEVLCALAVQGDRSAEEALVLRYNRLVRSCARPFFLMGADHEDLIQEGMIGLVKAVRDYDAGRGAAFRAYAERCIRNRMISAIRAASGGKQAALNTSVSLDEEGEEHLSYQEDPETLLISREEFQERLAQLHSTLTTLEDRVLGLYLQGLSYREIGQRLNRSHKSIDNAVQRIRRKLRYAS